MSLFYLNFDVSDLDSLTDFAEVVSKEATDAAVKLTQATYVHLIEEAEKKLHARRQKFIDALSVGKEGDVYFVNLDADAAWINDGQEPWSIAEALLSSPNAHTTKDGSGKYAIVPFDFSPGQGPTKTTQAKQDLINTIKQELKDLDIPYSKIERHPDGQPKTGLLHSDIHVLDKPIKPHHGPEMGVGPIGKVRQGHTGTPFLQGIRIYQQGTGEKDRQGFEKVKRLVFTFRTVSSKDIGSNKWQHPGLEPTFIWEEAEKWALDQWTKEIAPDLIKRIMAGL